jgi:hypothetical protein
VGYLPTEGRNFNPDVLEFGFDAPWWNAKSKAMEVNTSAMRAAFRRIYDFIEPWGLSALKTGVGQSNPWTWYILVNGKTAMANLGYYGPTQLTSRGAKAEFGYTWHPTLSGKRATGLTGWGLAIPDGAQMDEAWKFIVFLSTDLEAARILFDTMGYFPASKRFFSSFRAPNAGTKRFMDAVATNQWTFPEDGRPNYGGGIAAKALKEAANQVFAGTTPIENALEAAQQYVNVEVDKVNGK